jgi:uncharacterized membrane protein YjjP (DUF1212 family)
MTAASASVGETRRTLRQIAAAYGVTDSESVVLPNTVVIKAGSGAHTIIDLASGVNRALRLDQTADVYTLAREAEHGALTPAAGLARLGQIWAQAPRFGPHVRVAGHAILVMGFGLILLPSLSELVICALLGTLVGVLELCGRTQPTLRILLPVVSAFLVGALVFVLVKSGLTTTSVPRLIPPLTTFLPGTLLTTAMLELASGEMISGASRLVSGSAQLVLLVFGLVAATQVIGVPASAAFHRGSEVLLGPWAPWLGVAVVGIGVYLHFAAPRGSLPWLWLVLYVAWVGQQIGSAWLGGYIGSFLGALAMTPVALLIQRRDGAPPAQVTFLPAFWLLVPGALGVIGLTQLAADNRQGGWTDIGEMVFTLVAIALGILVGVALAQTLTAPTRRDAHDDL